MLVLRITFARGTSFERIDFDPATLAGKLEERVQTQVEACSSRAAPDANRESQFVDLGGLGYVGKLALHQRFTETSEPATQILQITRPHVIPVLAAKNLLECIGHTSRF